MSLQRARIHKMNLMEGLVVIPPECLNIFNITELNAEK